MKTFLVLICTVAIACAAGGAQEKNKSKKPAQKKSQAQSTQHAAAPSGGPQKTKGSQQGTKIGGTPVSGGGQKTKGKAKGSQYTAASGGYSAPSGAQKTKKAKGSQQVTTAGAGAQKTKKAKGSQRIATQGGQAVGGGHQKAKGSQQVVAAGKYTGSSTYSKKTKQSKWSATSLPPRFSQALRDTRPISSISRPTRVRQRSRQRTFQQNRHIQGAKLARSKLLGLRFRLCVAREEHWNNHYNRVVFVYGGWYYWNAGWWYPAWGSDSNAYYAYDGPIYAYNNLPPDQVIANVQAALQQRGCYQGEVDGLLGPITRAAVADYQRDHGLYITSAIDRPTLSSLGMT
jgi:hypothetical protein